MNNKFFEAKVFPAKTGQISQVFSLYRSCKIQEAVYVVAGKTRLSFANKNTGEITFHKDYAEAEHNMNVINTINEFQDVPHTVYINRLVHLQRTTIKNFKREKKISKTYEIVEELDWPFDITVYKRISMIRREDVFSVGRACISSKDTIKECKERKENIEQMSSIKKMIEEQGTIVLMQRVKA